MPLPDAESPELKDVPANTPVASGPAAEIEQWLVAEYRKAIGVLPGRRLGALGRKFPARSLRGPPYALAGMQHMVRYLKLRLSHSMGGSYACLVLTAEHATARSNYAMAYWRLEGDRPAAVPEYVCASPTFKSRDGEYRDNFIRYDALSRVAPALEPVLAQIRQLLADGTLQLSSVGLPDSTAAAAEALRLPELLLATTLTFTLPNYFDPEANEAYATLARAIHAALPDMSAFEAARLTFTKLITKGVFGCGQKLTPLTVREIMAPQDMSFSAWRELHVGQAASDLLLNFVAPSFAFYNQWAVVGAGPELFENPAMSAKYHRSAEAAAAVAQLRGARHALGRVEEKNHYSEGLDQLTLEAVKHAQSYLLMSRHALLHTLESLHCSLGGVAHSRWARVSANTAAEAVASEGAVAHLFFTAAYGNHCLHAKLGVAHTDEHGGNVALSQWGAATCLHRGVRFRAYRNPVVAYVAGPRGEADTYLFPAGGARACLIDFSRAILGPAYRERLESGRGPQAVDNYYRDQAHRVLRILHAYAPAFVESHQADLKAAILVNYAAVFPVLCAVDFIALGRSFRAAFAPGAVTGPEAVRVEAHPSLAALALALETRAREIFVAGLHDLAENRGRGAAPFPGAELLEHVFGRWRVTQWAAADLREAQLADAYNFTNELAYSGASYSKFPPWARLEEIEKHLGGLTVEQLFAQGPEAFLEAILPGPAANIAAEQVRAEQDALDGVAPPASTSWLDI